MSKLAKRMEQITESITLATSAKSKKLIAKGIDIIGLGVGEPDFQTADTIKAAAIEAIQNGRASYYTPTAGLPALRDAVRKRTQQDTGLTYADEEVIVTDGAKNALYNLFQAILNPKDEVLVLAPFWVSYTEQVKLAEGTPVLVNGQPEKDYKITVSELEEKRTNQTKALILNSPSNPTGMIYTRE